MPKAMMPVMTYPGGETHAFYEEVAACGFTVALVAGPTAEENRRRLEWCADVGLRAIVGDARITRDLPKQDGWRDVVRAVVADYAGSESLWGYLLTDEPSAAAFDELGQLTEAFREMDPTHIAYTNLFPLYADANQLGTVSYAEHVRRFLDVVRPTWLSYDFYPLLDDGSVRPGWFENLAIAREAAGDTPFCLWLQTCALANWRIPTADEIRWQVYTALAYGAKGIGAFTYQTLDAEDFRGAPTSIHRQKGPLWAGMQQINLELQALAPYLMELRSTRVGATWRDDNDNGGLVSSARGGELLWGEFVDGEGHPWVLVVNADMRRSAFAEIALRTDLTTLHEVARSTGELRPVRRDQGVRAEGAYADGMIVRFWLAPGDGRLMRLSGRT